MKLKSCRGRKSQLGVSCQIMTNPCCGLAVTFCCFISHLIGCETINIPEIFSGVHGFTGKTVRESGLLQVKIREEQWIENLPGFLFAGFLKFEENIDLSAPLYFQGIR